MSGAERGPGSDSSGHAAAAELSALSQRLVALPPARQAALLAFNEVLDLAGLSEPAPRPSRRQLQPCGTPAAYRRHQRSGEEPCEACREAHRVYRREEKRRARRRRAQRNAERRAQQPAELAATAWYA